MSIFNQINTSLGEVGQAILILAASVGIGWLLLRALNTGIGRFTRRSRTELDDAIMSALSLPLLLIIFLIALNYSLARITFLPDTWAEYLSDAFFAMYLACAYLLAYRLTRNVVNWYTREIAIRTETPLDEQIMPFFRRTLHILLTIIAAIILLGHFQIEVGALITTLGIGSLAIALAAQATLADTISGFVIMVDRPFRIGDRIELLDLDTWGDVVDIGMRSTRILTRDNRMVVVPNSAIGKSLVVNHSIPNTCYRVQTELGVAYGTDIEQARKTMIEAVRAQDWVMKDERIEALFLRYGDSAMIFRVRCWIEHYVETRRIIDKLNTCLYDALEQAGIETPFPQHVVYIQSNQAHQLAN